MTASTTLLALDLAGTFAFALNGALTAIRLARLDVVGVITLGTLTALGGGFLRDVLLDALPPATFSDWRYLAVAAGGGVVAMVAGSSLDRLARPILLLDTAGLSLFAVSGALKGLDLHVGILQAVILGTLTAVGGGTLRDVLIREVPSVLTSGLYAVPAMIGALILVLGHRAGLAVLPTAVAGAAACAVVRLLGVRYDVHLPGPRGSRPGG